MTNLDTGARRQRPASPYQLSLLVATMLASLLAGPATAGQDTITPDVVYGHKDGMALTYDVFHPEGTPNGAGIIWMVSGGWVSRWAPPEAARARYTDLLDAGFTVYQVRHGSSPRYKVPEAVEDVRLALRHIRANAARVGVDPDRLGVWGGSAGGHLSLMLGLNPEGGDDGAGTGAGGAGSSAEDSRVAAVVAYFPPVDLRPMAGPSERFPALDFDPRLGPAVSPILFVTPDDPPTLLVHGDADELVPLSHSERIFAALQGAGVTSELIVIEGGDHGFREPAHRARARAAVLAWFDEHLR